MNVNPYHTEKSYSKKPCTELKVPYTALPICSEISTEVRSETDLILHDILDDLSVNLQAVIERDMSV